MNVLVTAEFFGYGPVISCIYIVEELKKYLPARYVFLGSGISKEQAEKTNLFDEIVDCETHNLESLKEKDSYFKKANFVLSVENLMGAIYSVRNGYSVYYVDNLFWMWKDIPEELENVEAYFMLDIFDVDKNIDRIGNKINNIVKIGLLRRDIYYVDVSKKNQLLVNLGGGESFLSNHDLVCDFYTEIIKCIDKVASERKIERIIVCGGSNVVNRIKLKINSKQISYFSFSKEKYLEVLSESEYVIITPGLGNYFEAMRLRNEVLILPPINYSQFLQTEEYRKQKLGFEIMNWNDFDFYSKVNLYNEENVGVSEVLNNLKLFLNDSDNIRKYEEFVRNFLFKDREEWQAKRKEYVDKIGRNGINSVVTEIMKIYTPSSKMCGLKL